MEDPTLEWIITLHNHEDLEDFYNDMETPGGNLFIPDRAVGVEKRRSISRNTHYMLTPAEAALVKQDERVWDVDMADMIENRPTYEFLGNFNKTTSGDANHINWGILRHTIEDNLSDWGLPGTSNKIRDVNITASGKNVDVVIFDGHFDPSHPEFAAPDTLISQYTNGALTNDSSNGAVFDRSITVRGIKCVIAGAVGGQTAVPDAWALKTAKAITLLIDPTYPLINKSQQIKLIKTLEGAAGTTHAGLPTAQRVAWGGGASYSPNFLTDSGAAQYSGYQNFLNNNVMDDMVWYRNTSGPNPPTSDRDIEEIIEHLFHTIHNFGIPGAVPGSETEVPMQSLGPILEGNPSFSWTTTELHLAMKEAIDASLYDPSGYSTDWATDADAAMVAYKEYTYLVNWSMWDMSQFWENESLETEWSDTLKTPAGMLANNPLGHALFKKYFEPVLSKPDFVVLQDIFRDNDAGPDYYFAQTNGASRVKQVNWFQNDIGSGTGTYAYTPYIDAAYADNNGDGVPDRTDDNNHGCHVAGTVAGNKQGWARDANIYNISIYGTNQNFGTNGLSSSTYWDYVRAWHNAKTVNPATGRKNPTITNHSYGSSQTLRAYTGSSGAVYSLPEKIEYRGTEYDKGSALVETDYTSRGIYTTDDTPTVQAYFTSRFADIQDAIDDGIIVVAAAGNDRNKITNSTDQDYNNKVYWPYTFFGFDYEATVYTHRGTGSAAGKPEVIVVGAMSNDTDEKKAEFSNTGTQVDIYAAGETIQSSLNTNQYASYGPYTDSRDSNYEGAKYYGTSMASPQAAGVLAILAESWPNMTQAEAQQWIIDNASDDKMFDSGADNPMDLTSLQGGPNKILRWINQRPEEGFAYPQRNFKPRPTTGAVYPRTKIRKRG